MIELPPMPNETVFSWITRYHLRVSAGADKNTYQTLFNKEKVRIHAYLPNGLKYLEAKGKLSSNQWINEHTLYPLFHFFGHDTKGALINAMLTNSGCTVSNAHIPHSKWSFPYGHKFCPTCAQENLSQIGFAYYDIRCQIPGVEVCPQHHCYLQYTACGDYGLDRHLTLPKEFRHIVHCQPILTRFAQFCFDVLAYSQTNLTPRSLRSNYRKVLAERGFITKCSHIRMQQLIDTLVIFYRDFPFKDGWKAAADFHFLGPLLRDKTQTPCHPAKHLLLSFWLFDGVASKYSAELAEYSPAKGPTAPKNSDIDDNQILALIEQGLSMEQVSEQTGRSRCYIKRRCELAGISHQTNANAFEACTRHAVFIQALLGRHRQVIADNLNVGVGYVEQVIANTRGLVQWRKDLRVQRGINAAALELKQAKCLHPKWHRKDYKAQHNKAFFYLYRYARHRLEAILPPKLAPRPPKRDWVAEDKRLFEAISHLEGVVDMSLTAITQQVNDHGHVCKRLNALPKTKALLELLGKLPSAK